MEVQVEVKWIIEDERSNGYILQLYEVEQDKSRVLPVVIGAVEAHAIALELQGIKPFRPFTHDLAVQILESMNVEVEKIVITSFDKNTYFASIFLNSNTLGNHVVDSRPSDAVAIAVRVSAPIFVNEDLMDASGFEIGDEEEQEALETKTKTVFKTEKERLEALLEKAVEEENYEYAAKLRDQITNLRKK